MVRKLFTFFQTLQNISKSVIHQTSSVGLTVMFCLMKLQLYISSLTNRKMIDTGVMCLGCLCSLALWHFVSTFYFMEILDVPPNPKDFLEQTGWRKYISIKRDLSVYHLIEKYWISSEIPWWTFSYKLWSHNKSFVFI